MPAEPDRLLVAAEHLLQQRPEIIGLAVEAAVDVADGAHDGHHGVGIGLEIVPLGRFGPAAGQDDVMLIQYMVVRDEQIHPVTMTFLAENEGEATAVMEEIIASWQWE